MTNVNMNRAQRRKHAAEMRAVYNNAPTMIHEDDYIITDCVLCGATMTSIHDTHAAYPLRPYQTAKQANADGNTGRCCSACNADSVMRARLGPLFGDETETHSIPFAVGVAATHSNALDAALSQQAKDDA